jgi:hypothetical protein
VVRLVAVMDTELLSTVGEDQPKVSPARYEGRRTRAWEPF